MMERNFYNDDFEELIREKTDQYKMYPSDKVWKEVYNSLHTKRRRFVLGMSVLISGILILAGKELLSPSRPLNVKRTAAIVTADSSKTSQPEVSLIFPAFKKESPGQSTSDASASGNSSVTKEATPWDIRATQPDIMTQQLNITAPELSEAATRQTETDKVAVPSSGYNSTAASRVLTYVPKNAGNTNSIENLSADINSNIAVPILVVPPSAPDANTAEAGAAKPVQQAAADKPDEEDKNQISWLQDNAIQHLTPVKKHKLDWQVYFSPTTNYRKLSGGDYANSKIIVQNIPLALLHIGSANDFVDHTPAIGYEVGGSMLYSITRNLSFKAGLQFNYSRYFIKAYTSNLELATITLNSYYGYLADSITAYTNLRNFGGKSERRIQNRYFQLSAPIGIELRVMGNGKLQLNVGATIQPTYLLNRNSYLLTTDYTSYTKEPSLFRRWNINGGLEAFVSYQMGGTRLQIGPQFRYQLLSTYTDQYPLKENLMEYGFKIGISRSIRKK
jgi:hypothetical protein